MHDTLRSRVASLSIEARKALDEAALRASEAGHFEITCDHFLFALIGQQPRLAEGLSRHCGLDLQALQVELKRRLQDQPDGNAQSVVFSESLVGVLDDAWERACLQWGTRRLVWRVAGRHGSNRADRIIRKWPAARLAYLRCVCGSGMVAHPRSWAADVWTGSRGAEGVWPQLDAASA